MPRSPTISSMGSPGINLMSEKARMVTPMKCRDHHAQPDQREEEHQPAVSLRDASVSATVSDGCHSAARYRGRLLQVDTVEGVTAEAGRCGNRPHSCAPA